MRHTKTLVLSEDDVTGLTLIRQLELSAGSPQIQPYFNSSNLTLFLEDTEPIVFVTHLLQESSVMRHESYAMQQLEHLRTVCNDYPTFYGKHHVGELWVATILLRPVVTLMVKAAYSGKPAWGGRCRNVPACVENQLTSAIHDIVSV